MKWSLHLLNIIALFFFFTFTSTASARSYNDRLGLGVIIGEPTGISGKYWVEDNRAWDFAVAWSFSDSFLILGDHLWHRLQIFGDGSQFAQELNGYLGVGAVVRITNSDSSKSKNKDSSLALGARMPLGLEWVPADPSLGVFLEIAPGIQVVSAVKAFVQGGIGVRYYFK